MIFRLLLVGLALLASGFVRASLEVEVLSRVTGEVVSLPGAVVWAVPVSKDSDDAPAPAAADAEMEQISRQFNPYILPVQVNVPVHFPNRDSTAHHVYSFSETRQFELPLYKKKAPEPITFSRPGLVPLGCNIHDWMIGYILVVDTPYFVQFEGTSITLDHLPAGVYELKLWHPSLDGRETLEQVVTVTGSPAKVFFNLKFPLRPAVQPEAPEERFDEDYDF